MEHIDSTGVDGLALKFEELGMKDRRHEEENGKLAGTLSDYKIANMNLDIKLEKKIAMVTANLQEYRRMKGKVRNLRNQNEMLNGNVESRITKAAKQLRVQSKMNDRILNRVEAEFDSLAMQVFRRISDWSEKESFRAVL